MHRSPADPYAGRDRGVGGHRRCRRRAARPCGSSPRRGPAPACRARCRSRRRAARSASSRRSSPPRCRDARGCRSTATLSPCTTLNTPSGRPACASSSARNSDADGSFSTASARTCCRTRSALANIQIGTIAGKLNGVMPATTPSGWRIEYTSTPVAACSLNPPFSRCGDAARELDVLDAPRDLAQRVGGTLPCSAVTRAAISARLRVEQLPEAEQDLGPARQRRGAATSGTRRSRPRRLRRPLPRREADLGGCSPVAGSYTGPCAPSGTGTRLPPIQWSMSSCVLIIVRYSHSAAAQVAPVTLGPQVLAVDGRRRCRVTSRCRRGPATTVPSYAE